MDLGSVLAIASGATAVGAGIWNSLHQMTRRPSSLAHEGAHAVLLGEVHQTGGEELIVLEEQGTLIKIFRKGTAQPAEEAPQKR